jgi:hypothetical protein
LTTPIIGTASNPSSLIACPRADLPFATVYHYQVRQLTVLFLEATVTTKHSLAHRSEIVCALNGLDAEATILRAVHSAVVEDDERGDVFRALYVRDVERFDARRQARQL